MQWYFANEAIVRLRRSRVLCRDFLAAFGDETVRAISGIDRLKPERFIEKSPESQTHTESWPRTAPQLHFESQTRLNGRCGLKRIHTERANQARRTMANIGERQSSANLGERSSAFPNLSPNLNTLYRPTGVVSPANFRVLPYC